MATWPTILTFIATCLAIELTPGPNMTYLAMVAATQGRRAGFAMVAGVALGLTLVGIAAAIGLAALILAQPPLYQLLRWAGVGYLLWLAWEAWQNGTIGRASEVKVAPSLRELFRRGWIVNMLNPKAGVFFIAILPAFVDPNRSVAPQTITLSIVYVLVATLVHAAIVMLAGRLRTWLEDPDRSARASRVMAVLLAGVAVWFAIGTRR